MKTVNELIELKVPANEITDEVLTKLSYAIEYFSFQGFVSDADLEYWRETRPVLVKRLEEIENKKFNDMLKRPKTKLNIRGQLWEPCKCGCEPILLETMLCEKCS